MNKREGILAALIAAGLACITYGVGMMWAPAGWVVGGLSLIVLSVLLLVEV